MSLGKGGRQCNNAGHIPRQGKTEKERWIPTFAKGSRNKRSLMEACSRSRWSHNPMAGIPLIYDTAEIMFTCEYLVKWMDWGDMFSSWAREREMQTTRRHLGDWFWSFFPCCASMDLIIRWRVKWWGKISNADNIFLQNLSPTCLTR